MKRQNENKPESFEDITGISEERMEELSAICLESEHRMEAMNLVPLNKGGEQYINDRYPIRALYTRAELQEIAMSDFDTYLTEHEIQDIRSLVCDNFPNEINIAIQNAVESIIKQRGGPSPR